jgi:hypothetical protein
MKIHKTMKETLPRDTLPRKANLPVYHRAKIRLFTPYFYPDSRAISFPKFLYEDRVAPEFTDFPRRSAPFEVT